MKCGIHEYWFKGLLIGMMVGILGPIPFNGLLRGHANSDFTKLETSKIKNPSSDIYYCTSLNFPPKSLSMKISGEFFFAAISYISSHCIYPLLALSLKSTLLTLVTKIESIFLQYKSRNNT